MVKANKTRQKVRASAPYIPKTDEKAACVSGAPSRPETVHFPVTMTESPVKVQMMIVSIKVPVIEISPCSTGSSVLAAAAAIGADPNPDSLEKTPRAIPF